MRLFTGLALALSFVISIASPSLGHVHQGRRHHVQRQNDLARRDPGELHLYKRFDNARFTYYAVGLGACGQVNQPSDFIVALNSDQFNGGQYCFQMISITIGGETQTAQIMDECPGCPYAGLDFSQGLFQAFSSISAGVLYGSWEFGSGGGSPSSSPPPPPPPPTTTWVPPPTTTSQPPPPTTTSQPPPPPTTSSTSTTPTTTPSSTHSSASSSTSSSSSAVLSTTNTATPSAVPSGTGDSSTLLDLNLYMVLTGQFLNGCGGN